MSSAPEQGSTPTGPAGEPIAVVGIGCRLPGDIRDLNALSRVLMAAQPLLAPVPRDRWGAEFHDPDGRRAGTSNCHVGAFLSDIQRFDADFFGVSPREAREMDPQQRVLLEVAAEALESTGCSGGDWAGTRTGVFAGVLANDYLLLHGRTRGLEKIDPFFATGKEFSFGAGRIAYTFDLRGPVMTVTTACSSSLLAVHLACQSLRAGECDTALAGGVNILLAPDLTVFMSRVGALSASGHCSPFSADADGVVRGEGCALVLLKRLSDAQRDGDDILAVLNGSAVNHDGRSAGLTMPSAPAQVQLLRQALRSAGIGAAEIGYVEAHATGTPLGDPIELAALSEVFDREVDDPGQALLVGSHKAVFGHLDSAAGILGLLKAILVVRDGIVPAQPVIRALSPAFDWQSSDLRIARERTDLVCAPTTPRRAGVSAFGLSGTNVHMIVSQSPAPTSDPGQPVRVRPTAAPVRIWGGDAYWLSGVRPGQQHASIGSGQAPSTSAQPAPEPEPILSIDAWADVPARVAGAVRTVLGLEPAAVLPGTRSLLDMGLNSITAVELSALLAEEFRTEPDATLAYLCPTVDELVDNFSQPQSAAVSRPTSPDEPLRLGDARPVEPAPPEDAVRSRAEHSALAIVGMACRVPGAESIDEFWKMVCDGEHQIRDLPARRVERDGWSAVGAEVPRRGGYLDRIEGFDAPFFRISPLEAARMDPQQRLFLEVACEAMSDAGIVVGTPLAHRTGVYTGMNTTDYQRLLTRDQADVDIYFGTGNSFSGTPGRLAYTLDLGGPSMSVDTACSSSLTAIHLAGQALRAGDCDAAVAGGVNVISGPTVSVSMARGGALAPDGRCKTFAESADGYGRGEGAGVVVLKRLADAIEAGDRIYATILGSAVNSDGASGGFTVPNAAAQTRAVSAALVSAAIAPADVGYVETHGTGTPLGDPIELKALGKALRSGLPDRHQPVAVGSVKSLIGHLEAAAGVVGLIKAGLAIYQSRIPAHVLSGPPTSRVDWEELGLRPADANFGWPQGRSRVAGVSAFGFTGSNAHVILGQAPEIQSPARPSPPALTVLPISAATESGLRAAAGRLASVLTAATPLADISFTLARRRSSHNFRAVVIANNSAAAAQALASLAGGTAHPAVVFSAHPVNGPDPLRVHFGPDAYLGAGWADLPQELLHAANDACAQMDALMPMLAADTSIECRQRLAGVRAQIGWTAIWRQLGLELSSAHGEGVGAHTAAWLCGQLDVAALLELAVSATAAEDELAAAAGPERGQGPTIDAVPSGMPASGAMAYVQAQAYVLGLPVSWAGVVPDRGRPTALPAYPWERRDYWFVPAGASGARSDDSPDRDADASAHRIGAQRQPATAIRGAASKSDGLLFTHEWSRRLPPPATAVSPGNGNWLIFGAPDSALVASVRRGLSDVGAQVRTVAIPGGEARDWARELSSIGKTGTPAGVVLIVGQESDAARLVMRFGQAVGRFPGQVGRAHLITSGAHPEPTVVGRMPEPDPEQAGAWSVASVLATELSRRWGRTIDVTSSVEPGTVAAALLADQLDDQLRLVAGAWYHRRIRRYSPPADVDPRPSGVESDSLFAVCGTDAQSVQPVLNWLQGHGAGVPLVHLRAQGPDQSGAQEGRWLEQLSTLITDPRFGGVIYCCDGDDTQVTVRDSGEAELEATGEADELLAAVAERMEHSSRGLLLVVEDAAAEWGAVGAAVAGARRARSLARLHTPFRSVSQRVKVISLLPRERGNHPEASSPLLEGSGIGRLTGEQVETILELVHAEPAFEALSAGVIDVDRYVSVCQRLAPRALLDDLAAESGSAEVESALATELRALGPTRRAERLLELVLSSTAAVLDMQAREINPRMGFFDLGMNSITALALKTRLEGETLTELPATLTFELPTPRQVADHLCGLLTAASDSPASNPPLTSAPDSGTWDSEPNGTAGTAGQSTDAPGPTDEALLRMLSEATSSARDLLEESPWS
jgi:acyl transferase domain-containing protein/acyl carrier protein